MRKDFKIIFTLEEVRSYLHTAENLDEALLPVVEMIFNDSNTPVESITLNEGALHIRAVELIDPVTFPESSLSVAIRENGVRETVHFKLSEWFKKFDLYITSSKTHITHFVAKPSSAKARTLDKSVIKKVCLEHGYTEREQADGGFDLNEYVYKVAQLFYEMGLKEGER